MLNNELDNIKLKYISKCIEHVNFFRWFHRTGETMTIRVKLFNGVWHKIFTGFPYNEFYVTEDNNVRTEWFSRNKFIPILNIEEIWLDKNPLYLNGLYSLGDNVYPCIFYMTIDESNKFDICRYGKLSKEEVVKNREFLK